MSNKIKDIARKQGFDDAKYVGKWREHKVYEAIFTDGETHCIGFPQYIIKEGGDILRWSKNWEESMDIMSDTEK